MASLDQRLVNHIHAILIEEWDPIGISSEPLAQDEYDSYIPSILGLLRAQTDVMRVATHLVDIEQQRMGLFGDRDHAIRIAQRLLATYQRHQQPVTLPLYTRVRFLTDRYRDAHAPCGMVGYIIEIHRPDAYEVECSAADGLTIAQVVVHPDELMPDEAPSR